MTFLKFLAIYVSLITLRFVRNSARAPSTVPPSLSPPTFYFDSIFLPVLFPLLSRFARLRATSACVSLSPSLDSPARFSLAFYFAPSLSLSLFESCFYFPSSTFLPPLFPSSARRNSAQRGAPLSSFAFVAKPINESFLFKFDSGVLLYHPNLKKYNVSYL